jgi:hypothetical protein
VLFVKDGRQRDHLPILLEAKIKSRKAPRKKVRPDKTKAKEQLRCIAKVSSEAPSLPTKISEAINNDPAYSILASTIMAATKATAAEVDTPKPDWFERNKNELLELIDDINSTHIDFIQGDSHRNQIRAT